MDRDTLPITLMSTKATALAMFLCLALCSCDRRPFPIWERPWTCWRNEDYTYFCSATKSTWDRSTWDSWSRENSQKPAIAFNCATQYWDPEVDSWDFLCRAYFSEQARGMDDETAPRFHCFGNQGSALHADDVDFHCDPYWLLKSDVRKRGGSGWFLWLALQTQEPEKARLITLATQIADREKTELLALLDKKRAQKALDAQNPQPEPTVDIETLLQDLRQDLKEIQARRDTPRSGKEIRERLQKEQEAWQSDFPLQSPWHDR